MNPIKFRVVRNKFSKLFEILSLHLSNIIILNKTVEENIINEKDNLARMWRLSSRL